jgi:hypothetical protein
VNQRYFSLDRAEEEYHVQTVGLSDQKLTKNLVLQVLLIFT